MNWFGKSKKSEASTTVRPAPASTATDTSATIIRLRENIAGQEKR